MKETILSILKDSVTAPSPDNYQPWRFEVKGADVFIFKVPGLVNHLLDCHEHVLLLTDGMLLENMAIAATAHGCRSNIQLLPPGTAPDCVAKVSLEKSDGKPDPLHAHLYKRCTNRKPYSSRAVEPAIVHELSATAEEYPGLNISIVTDQSKVKQLGKAVAVMDRIMFENQALHDSLFEHITWTREEEQRTHVGLNLDSMEFKPPEKLMFRALKNWGFVKAMNFTGFSRFVGFKSGMQYGAATGAVIGSVNTESPEAYLLAGRCMQRLWLKATAHGLSMHPIVGAIYCYQKVEVERTEQFSAVHEQWLRNSYAQLQSAAGTKNPLVFFLRMGYGKPTTYQSTRKSPDVRFA